MNNRRKNLSLLIKPASSLCNLNCRYCFYKDEASKRNIASHGIMGFETAEQIIDEAFKTARSCSFTFQGGEPCLAGLDYYEHFINYVNSIMEPCDSVSYSIQTNGTLIDGEWAEFFFRNSFLVGLSLDGTKAIHEKLRGTGTYNQVLNAASLLKKHRVDFNILTVVTDTVSEKAREIYSFYKRKGFNVQQYIPVLEPYGEEGSERDYSLEPEKYGKFLIELWDLWYADAMTSSPVSIRYFENLYRMMRGLPAEQCGLSGRCSLQYVTESDGSVYPCDFYCMDDYCLGNITEKSFDEIDKAEKQLGFTHKSRVISAECKKCPHILLCRGGCRREFNSSGKTMFCESYKMLFGHI